MSSLPQISARGAVAGRGGTAAAILALSIITGSCVQGPPRGRSTPSEEVLRAAVRLRGLALADMEDGRYQQAVERLETLSDLLPENLLPPINLAICYLRLNRRAEAWSEIERARALDPTNPQMLYTLARLLDEEADASARRDDLLATFRAAHPHDVRPHYLEAEMRARQRDFGAAAAALERALDEEPENIVLLADLLVAAVESGDRETTLDALNALEDRLDGFDGTLADYAAELKALAPGELATARPAAVVMRNILRPSELYQVHLAPLVGGRGLGGDLFPQLDFVPPLPKRVQGGLDIGIVFREATAELPPGLAATRPLATVGSPPGTEAILALRSGRPGLWRRIAGALSFDTFTDLESAARMVLLHPFDGDETPDLVTAGLDGTVRIAAGLDGGGFAAPQEIVAGNPAALVATLAPLDIDHDGDLDLFVGRRAAPDLYLQNDGDGSWSERASDLEIAGPPADTLRVLVFDVEDDGDLDLLTLHGRSRPRLYLNQRGGRLLEAGESYGLGGTSGSDGTVADLDNDGLFDLLLWGHGDAYRLDNRGRHFEPIELPSRLQGTWLAAAAADFDNDGDIDLAIARADDPAILLARNRDRFLVVETVEAPAEGVERLLAADIDDDGDLDLVSATASGARLARNDGGNRNHWLRLALRGRSDNNSKNNVEGLFCRIEARAGDSYQTVIGNGAVNHLGLGSRRQVDVLRVVWTNGIAQLWQLLGTDRTLVEEQMLKGSCPFLYTWNGNEFAFVTDLMWKSPLGMVQTDGSPAPHQSARDFVLVPGEALVPAGDHLWLQVTEELWETVYVDRQYLTAVDYPAEYRLVVDEKVTAPPYATSAPLSWIDTALAPVSARDHDGRDVTDLVAARDGRHVGNLPLTRFQGLTEGHALVLRFDDVPGDRRLRLVLWGWVFPTDTSINTGLSQSGSPSVVGPALDLRTAAGEWREIEPFIGFPAGKRKAMVVELPSTHSAGEVILRLRTTLQIYWDAARLALGDPRPPFVSTRLEPASAELHSRGYSRLTRESPSSPHLFDYSRVAVGPRFRDMSGLFTRYGRVAELLAAEDDMYVVMSAGDEMTVRYDAARLPPLPDGWRRDWVLYTDGWVKDADINTTGSQTVEPLPFHGQRAYPDPALSYPDGQPHREYLDRYQTRRVTDLEFRHALRR